MFLTFVPHFRGGHCVCCTWMERGGGDMKFVRGLKRNTNIT